MITDLTWIGVPQLEKFNELDVFYAQLEGIPHGKVIRKKDIRGRIYLVVYRQFPCDQKKICLGRSRNDNVEIAKERLQFEVEVYYNGLGQPAKS